MCRGTREAKFTWVGSKYRPANKIRTLAWASLQASPVSESFPVLFEPLKCGALPAYPAHHNCDECVKRSDARHFILFVLVSLLVYNDNGLHLFSPMDVGRGDQEVAGGGRSGRRSEGRLRGGAAEMSLHILFCFCVVF